VGPTIQGRAIIDKNRKPVHHFLLYALMLSATPAPDLTFGKSQSIQC